MTLLRTLFIAGPVTFLVLAFVAMWYLWPASDRCLYEHEKAVYEVIEEGRPEKVRVSVIDTVASTTVWSQELDFTAGNHYHPVEVRSCGLYLLRKFNYDPKKSKQDVGYKDEVWRYPYFDGVAGKSIFRLTEKLPGGDFFAPYSLDFRIDPAEKYIILERSHMAKPDYALVIKNIKTGKDEYVLTLADILAKYPAAAGGFRFGEFYDKPDGTYLYGNLQDGPRWTALYSIKMGTWETEILPTPEDYLHGVERSIFFGDNTHLAYTDVIIWAGGVSEIEDAVLEEAIAEGRKKNLFVANLRTGVKTTVATVPIVKGHRFNPRWLSPTELTYTMPDGSNKIFLTATQ